MVAHTNNVIEDHWWFVDSGAYSHITNELENLTLQQQPFQCHELVVVGSGGSLEIENTSLAIFHSSKSQFHLRNILHCPKATTNLLSIQKLCQDNHCYFKLTPSHFFVKHN